MRITIAGLRTWILVLGVLLVVAIVGFFGYARFRLRELGRDLPQKLGLEIEQSTNNFTISKSREGHTLFVLHAAKAIQYKGGGHAVLHDVTIEIFAKDGSPADRISGSQFDYDASTKIARADGAVDIELTNPESPETAKKNTVPPTTPREPVKVKTSGLVFNQETQIASTDQPLTFQQGEISGAARGATYDSGKGTLQLAHEVALHTEIDGDPVDVKAQSANFDRSSRQLYLVKQETDYQQKHGSSDQAVVFLGANGSADHMTAQGNVHVKTDDGSDLQASSGRAQFDDKGVLTQIKLDGGLLFISRDARYSRHVDSTSGILTFAAGRDRKAVPKHVRLVGAVSIVDQELTLPSDPHGSETREARAQQMDVDLVPDNTGHVQAQSLLANGSAVVVVHSIRENAPQQISELKGSQIYATIENGHDLSTLRATGDTSIAQSTPGGIERTSSGDNLMVKFLQGKPKNGEAVQATARIAAHTKSLSGLSAEGNQIESAVEQGHALLVQTQPAADPGSPPLTTTGSADRITYDGASGSIDLSGGTPRVKQDDSELTAAGIEFNQKSGNAVATGNVKATYASASSAKPNTATPDAAGPIHVVADRAALDHARDETSFFGAPHADARLWQGQSSITAPAIVLSRTRQLLTATGPAGEVRATFVESAEAGPAKPNGAAAKGGVRTQVVNTASSRLTYSGGERKATLSGGVVAQDAEGTLRCNQMELYLNQAGNFAPASSTVASAKSAGFMGPGGQVDRLIAEDHVQFDQGDRKGSGERLVYTAEDGRFVLTGTSASPPRISDPEHGTVTGSSLTFNNRDDSVVVSHGTTPTETDTRTHKDSSGSHHGAGAL